MLVTFSCPTRADIIMFGDIALKLIGMMGKPERAPGVIKAADIPNALHLLRQGLAAEDAARKEQETGNEQGDDEQPVSLHNRALPLIDMLNAAMENERTVMWEQGGRSY